MTLLIVRFDGPGTEGEGLAWSARSTKGGPELVLGEQDHRQMLAALEGNDRPEKCVQCGARCALMARSDEPGAEWAVAPPVDDLYCDRCWVLP